MSKAAVKKKFKPIRKNDPNAVAFRLVCRARDFGDDEDEVGDSGTYTWERVPFGKHEPQGIPRDVYMGLSPEEFGIYPHLPRAERMKLCLEIYGEPDVPKEVVDKFSKLKATTGERPTNSNGGEEDEGGIDLFDDEAEDSAACAGLSDGDLDFVIQQFGKDCIVQDLGTLTDDNDEAHDNRSAAKKRPLTRGTAPRGDNPNGDDSDMSHLEADCYFPVDGYNYKQHLRTVGLGGGIFIAAPIDKHNPEAKADTKKTYDVDDATAELLCTDEGKELLAALHIGGDLASDPAFALAEDFATQADGIDERVEKEMLWGAHGEAYWHGTTKTTTEVNSRALAMTREERIALLEANKCALGAASDSDTDNSEDEFERLLENGTNVNKDTDKVENFDIAFDKILADYEDELIGELDADDPDVLADTSAEFADYSQMFDDFLKGNTETNHAWVGHLKVHNDPTDNVLPPHDEENTRITRQYLQRDAEIPSGDESTDEDAEPAEPQWDCETILTTRSSLSHHPQRIGRPPASKVQVQTKLKVPFEGLTLEQQNSVKSLAQCGMARDAKSKSGGAMLSVVQEEETSGEVITLPAVQHRRLAGETPDERRERKKLVKQTQREVRKLKKESKKSIKNIEQDVRTKLAQKNAYDIREGTRHFKYT